MKDKDLLEAWNRYVATGDMAAFGQVYKALYDDTLYFAISKCNGIQLEATDIVAEIWEKLMVKKSQVEGNVRSYIFAVIKNTIIDILRKNNRIVSNEIPENALSESMKSAFLEEDEKKEHDLKIRRCLDEKEYILITQFGYLMQGGHDRQEANKLLAEASGKALQTINNKRSSIMKKLKKCIKQ